MYLYHKILKEYNLTMEQLSNEVTKLINKTNPFGWGADVGIDSHRYNVSFIRCSENDPMESRSGFIPLVRIKYKTDNVNGSIIKCNLIVNDKSQK